MAENVIFSISTELEFRGRELKALKPNKDGVYTGIPLSLIGTASRNNMVYERESFMECLTDPRSRFVMNLKSGDLEGEWGHPLLSVDPKEMVQRLLYLDRTKVSHHFTRIYAKEDKQSGYTILYGDVKPSGPFKQSLIDNFEDQIVGHKAGDEFDVNVTFPEDYQEKSLAGKPAVFAIKVKEIKSKEVPALDEEYVQDTTSFDTVDEYKADVKKKLEESKENEAKRTKEDEALTKIVEKSEMDIPDAMVDTQVNNIINDYSRNLAQSGLSFQQYLQFTGMTIDKFREQTRPEAVKRIKTSLCLEAIAAAENLEATDEDIDKRIEDMAKQYNMKAEDLKTNVQDDEMDSFKEQIKMEKAIDFVMDHVKERAKRKSTKKTEDKEADKEEQ